MIKETADTAAPRHAELINLTGLRNLPLPQIELLLARAEHYAALPRRANKKLPLFRGRTQINLFFENSTRTRTSFEIAGQRLGMDIVNIDIAKSSVQKGETLLDTALTLNAMRPDIIAVRHSQSGTADFLAEKLSCAVVNAGDGTNEHPTQALLDALTIRQAKGRIAGLTIAVCGDIAHSRVARSNLFCLGRMGAKLRLVAPAALLPENAALNGADIFYSMEEGLKDADVIMMLRLQKERITRANIPSAEEYFHDFGLDEKRLALAKPDCIVLHPGPINREVEIASAVADGRQSRILAQVENGVAVRMAVTEALLLTREAANRDHANSRRNMA